MRTKCEKCKEDATYSIYLFHDKRTHNYCDKHFMELGCLLDDKEKQTWEEILDPELKRERKRAMARFLEKVSGKKPKKDLDKMSIGLICKICGHERLPTGTCPYCYMEKEKEKVRKQLL